MPQLAAQRPSRRLIIALHAPAFPPHVPDGLQRLAALKGRGVVRVAVQVLERCGQKLMSADSPVAPRLNHSHSELLQQA